MERAQEVYDNTIIEFYNYDKENYAMNKCAKTPIVAKSKRRKKKAEKKEENKKQQ